MAVINGVNINSNGKSVTISGGNIYIDGVAFDSKDSKIINIEITGDVDSLNIDICSKLGITGNCNSVKSHNGNIDIGGNVTLSVETHNGDVDCGNVGGNVVTKNGNIKHKK
jgi:hypothetical protein